MLTASAILVLGACSSQPGTPQTTRVPDAPPPAVNQQATSSTIATLPGFAGHPYELLTVAWNNPWAGVGWHEFNLLSDGGFTVRAEHEEDPTTGRIDGDVLTTLIGAAEAANLDATRRQLIAARGCNALFDGVDWAIVVAVEGSPRRFSTCVYELDGSVPVFAAAYEAFALARPDLAGGLWSTMRPKVPDFTVAVMVDATLMTSDGLELNNAGHELRKMLSITDGVFVAELAQGDAASVFGATNETYAWLAVDGVEALWILVGTLSRDAVEQTVELALSTEGVIGARTG